MSHRHHESPAFLKSILNSVADGIFTVDIDMKITSFNRAAMEISGYTPEEAFGRHCHEIFKTSVCNASCPLREAFNTGQTVVNRDLEIYDKNNRKIPISISASILRSADGEVTGGVETFRDLSVLTVLKREIIERYSFRDLVSRNAVMRRLFTAMQDIAASDATVLLQGESGTGKELFAKAAHDLSQRRGAPLVTINCGALPEHLLESEIFGSIKGSYTGSVENRPGRLEMAQGGTLFLDEIGDLPIQLQVKLLRVLENREFQPIGAKHPQKADVRFIAATHCDLEKMVDEGSFRRDLFFRINVVALKIPPLRERVEDIPLLLDMALERFNLRYNRRIRGFSPDALQILLRHTYPGNVRELLNIVEQTVILCHEGEIEAENLPPSLLYLPPSPGDTLTPPINEQVPQPTPELIREYLARFRGNKSRVARELGVDRTTLWRWMKKHDIYSGK